MSPAKVREWWDNLGPVTSALVALGGATSFGMMVALMLGGWLHLPDKVQDQGDAIVELREKLSDIRRTQHADSVRIARLDCIALATVRKRDPVQECDIP